VNDTLRVIHRSELGAGPWNGLVEASDAGWLWHRFEMQAALATWRRRRDLGFALVDEARSGQVQALVPVQQLRNRLGLATLESFGGPLLAEGAGHKYRARLLEAVHRQLLELAAACGAASINAVLPPLAPALRGERCPRINPLLEAGFDNALTQTWMVKLDGSAEKAWSRMEGRARTAVRKAEKSGVSIRPADRPGDLDVYYGLHCETYARTGVPPHPRAYFERIWSDFLPAGLARVWFAEAGGRVIAAENFAVYKQGAWYWTGAASAAGLAAEAGSLLQWHAMRWMAETGVEWYDTGEAFPGAREGKLKGLSDFKRSFGGELYPVFRGVLHTPGWRHRVGRAIRALIR
jgi:CelD/BcsL family acetyltransferase involved in cellulose biosynthesis